VILNGASTMQIHEPALNKAIRKRPDRRPILPQQVRDCGGQQLGVPGRARVAARQIEGIFGPEVSSRSRRFSRSSVVAIGIAYIMKRLHTVKRAILGARP
jgi:hypothetical protein